jgi:hypothetical protein
LNDDIRGVCCGDGFVNFCAASDYGGFLVKGYADAVEIRQIDDDEIVLFGKRGPSVSAVLS